MENIYYVYGYIRLDTNTYFYIGKGKKNRANRLDNRKSHFMNIVNKVRVCYEILYDNLTELEAFELERKTIEELVFDEGYSIDIPNYKCSKNTYAHLVNLTWGGDGTSGYSIKQTPETVANRVAKNLGKKRNDRQKENISKGLMSFWEKNPNHFSEIAKKRKSSGEKWHSDSTIEKIRQKAIGRERSKESVIKMLNTINNKSLEEKMKINKMRSEGVKNTKRKNSNLRIKILNENKYIVKEFTTVMECAEWLVEISVCKTVNGARDTINTKCNKDVLYKNKYYIIKEKLPLATTERENS